MYELFCKEFGEKTANEHISFCIRTAKKSKEEIHEEAEKAREKNSNIMKSFLEDILKIIEES